MDDLLASVTQDTIGVDGSYTSTNFLPIYNGYQQQQQQQQQQQSQQIQAQRQQFDYIQGQSILSVLREMNATMSRMATVMERELSMANIHIQKLELVTENARLDQKQRDRPTRRDDDDTKPKEKSTEKKVVEKKKQEGSGEKKKQEGSDEKRKQEGSDEKRKQEGSGEKRKHEGSGLYSKPTYAYMSKKPRK